MNILIVDDNGNDRALAYRAMRTAFPDAAIHLLNTAQAFDRFGEFASLDLVITDWDLKLGTGRRIITAVKGRMPGCPVIIFTGSVDDCRSLAAEEGADDCVLKSGDMNLLIAAARRCLQGV